MMRVKHLVYAFLIILLICSNSFAEEKSNPADQFLAITYLSRYTCKLTIGASEISECSEKKIINSKEYYFKAKKFVNKNNKATSMIKDYYAYWVTSMRSIMPKNQELELLYEQRIANDDRKLDEMRNRIKLELEL